MTSDPTVVLILFLTSVSTITTLLDALGFMPYALSKWLNRNRLAPTIAVLKEFGIDAEQYKRNNLARQYKRHFDRQSLSQSLQEELALITKNHRSKVILGKTSSVSTKEFIDLMGASTNPTKAELFSRYLSTYWSQLIERHEIQNVDFDFVVTPKEGSPILGYEFSKLVSKPFVLHRSQDKFKNSERLVPEQRFDFSSELGQGKLALIVDDSTTGGRMVLDAIQDLRANGYTVANCLVVFEPKLKNARSLIEQQGVKLHSIIETHS